MKTFYEGRGSEFVTSKILRQISKNKKKEEEAYKII